jgi:hypothetical protein
LPQNCSFVFSAALEARTRQTAIDQPGLVPVAAKKTRRKRFTARAESKMMGRIGSKGRTYNELV